MSPALDGISFLYLIKESLKGNVQKVIGRIVLRLIMPLIPVVLVIFEENNCIAYKHFIYEYQRMQISFL